MIGNSKPRVIPNIWLGFEPTRASCAGRHEGSKRRTQALMD